MNRNKILIIGSLGVTLVVGVFFLAPALSCYGEGRQLVDRGHEIKTRWQGALANAYQGIFDNEQLDKDTVQWKTNINSWEQRCVKQ